VEPGPRSPKGHRTRSRIVEAGQAIFERDGFQQARIADISAAAGVSHGLFYHYFRSKEELFRVIADDVETRLLAIDYSDADSAPIDQFDRIRLANRSYIRAYKREAKIMAVIEEVSRYDDDVRRARLKRDDFLAARLEASIIRLQSRKLADPRVDGRYAATALGGMVARFSEQMFVGGGKFDEDAAVEQLTLLWANALGLDSGPRVKPASPRGAKKAPTKTPASAKTATPAKKSAAARKSAPAKTAVPGKKATTKKSAPAKRR
jgi:AcrR family transcriptional regulator